MNEIERAIEYLKPIAEHPIMTGIYKKMLDIAIQALEKQIQSQWISVDERLPKYNRGVLTFAPNMAMPIVVDWYNGYYGEDDNEWYEGWNSGRNITHWMPLPLPPKGQKYD